MLHHLLWDISDIKPALAAIFVMCIILVPVLVVATAAMSWFRRRRFNRARAAVPTEEFAEDFA